MRQEIVGTYEIGYEQCQIVLREGTGGEFYFIPESGSIPRIKIGADYERWSDVVTVLLHEVFELSMERQRCRYEVSSDTARDHSAYMFMLPHVQFSDVCAKAAECITPALPALAKAWNKWKKSPVKRKK